MLAFAALAHSSERPPVSAADELMLQHLPQGLPHDPPKLSAPFYNRLHQSLIH
jgi:hypothetical protein